MALTPKQEAFCIAYSQGETIGNGVRSAAAAGYKGTDGVLGTNAYRLLKKPEVQKRLKELTSRIKEETQVDATILRARLWDLARRCESEGDRSNELGCYTKLGQSIAMFTDRVLSKDEDADAKLLSESEQAEAKRLVLLRMNQVERGTG